MRLFVAVWPSPEAIEHLSAAVDAVRSAPAAAGVRWQPVTRWHLTLAFLGDVPDARVPDLVGRLERAARRHEPAAPVRFRGAGTFGHRVLWIGVAAPPSLAALAASVQAGMRRAGIELEDRPWKAHLTLARFREGDVDPRPLAALLKGYEGPPWAAGSVSLVRSVLGRQPSYEDLAVVPVGRRAAAT